MKDLRIASYIPDSYLRCRFTGRNNKPYVGGVTHIEDNRPGLPYFRWWIDHAFPPVGVNQGEGKTFIEAVEALGEAMGRLS